MNGLHLFLPFQSLSRARQPLKAVWTALFTLLLPFRFGLLLLYFISKRGRPNPQWTYHQAVGNALLRIGFSFASTVEYQTVSSLEPGAEKERFVVMEPANPTSYLGVARDKFIQPAKIGGVWYPKLYQNEVEDGKMVALHLHGGAFVLGGVRPKEWGWGPGNLAKAIDGYVFCPQYRLSSGAKGRFPAALQDGITSYEYLLSQGIPSSRIVFSGDSAGGNLVLAMLRYVGEQRSPLPSPIAALLWSPWLDLAADSNSVEHHRNYKTDYLTPVLIRWGLRTYRPSFLDANHPYLSPFNNPFPTKVPIFMQNGTAELLFDEQVTFYSQMRDIAGNKVERFEVINAPHNIFLGGQLLGFEDEIIKATDKAYQFLKDQAITA